MDNLKSKTFSGFLWNLSERVGVRIIQFLPTILLARLLTPEEFGLIGMLTIFIAVAGSFLDSGFSLALIQKKDATYLDECSIFYFNLLVGVLLTLVLYLAAPSIATFYNQPNLTVITRALSFGILIEAFDLIQTTRLTRALDFKTQLKTTFLGSLVSGVLGVVTAYLGYGVWSLVIQSLVDDLLSTAALWVLCDWRPALLFSLDSLKEMFGFGSRMLLSALISTFFDNIYQVVIGKLFPIASLGYYTRATSLKTVVIDTTSNTFGRVMFPALAHIQDNVERLKRAYRKSVLLATFVHFPLMIGLVIIARPLFIVLFSVKWLSAVTFFQLMCVAGLLFPLHLINLDILKVKGRSDLFFKLEVIKRALIVANIILTYRYGVNAMLAGQIVLTVLAYLLNSYYSERLIGYAMKSQIIDFTPALVYSGIMALGMLGAGAFVKSMNSFIILIVQTAVGTAIYLFINWLRGSEALAEIISLVKQYFVRRDQPS
jgi:O-antigen/teichoic acid export membrane protein